MPRVPLTDKFCAAAKPQKGVRTDYFDTGARGLSLRVGERGHKAWSFNYTTPTGGKRARVQLGTYPAMSLAKARAQAIEARGQVEDGEDPRAMIAVELGGALTVATLIESYLAKHVRPNLRSAGKIEQRIKKNVIPAIGAARAADLHKRDINRMLDPIVARGKTVMAARVFEDVRAIFRWAVARGDLDHSPVEGMRKPHTTKPRERVLADDEICVLWNDLPQSLARSKQCQQIIKLCLVTAQRVGEVAGMRIDELDLDAQTWTLPGSRTKNGRRHIVPISDLALEIIRGVIQDDAVFVFPCGAGALGPDAVARTINRANETGRFGIEHFTAQDLRRTALTNFARMGIAPIVAGSVANHLSITKSTITLSVYTQYDYAQEKRAALDMWAEYLAEIIKGEGAKILPMQRAAS